MQIISSHQRHQLEFGCLDDKIAQDNPVRFIEAFVEHIDLVQLGFQARATQQEGRPGFDAKLFLKIYFYGYLNGIRSSRRLAKECACLGAGLPKGDLCLLHPAVSDRIPQMPHQNYRNSISNMPFLFV